MKNTRFLSTVLMATVMSVGFYSCKDKDAATEDGNAMETEETANDNYMDEESEEVTVMVGGAEMYPSKNIVENASQSKDHTTLVAAIAAAELVETLSSEGPFTVFAPTNAAFEALPKGTVETLLKPENKAKLQGILTYHVVPGNISSAAVLGMIKDGNGKAVAKTVAGGEITFTTAYGNVYLTDVAGNKAQVTIADANQSNGVIHVIDKVLMPTK
jgi:uncharacterized surface protein with fasciclin (FAS1) repeats